MGWVEYVAYMGQPVLGQTLKDASFEHSSVDIQILIRDYEQNICAHLQPTKANKPIFYFCMTRQKVFVGI
jgi:hypothetical protein